jgi:hypothetical protein
VCWFIAKIREEGDQRESDRCELKYNETIPFFSFFNWSWTASFRNK